MVLLIQPMKCDLRLHLQSFMGKKNFSECCLLAVCNCQVKVIIYHRSNVLNKNQPTTYFQDNLTVPFLFHRDGWPFSATMIRLMSAYFTLVTWRRPCEIQRYGFSFPYGCSEHWLINSILNCGENISEKTQNHLGICRKTLSNVAITEAYSLKYDIPTPS